MRSSGLRRLVTFSLAMLSFAPAAMPRLAMADVVGPRPLDCARGLRGASSHAGPFCEPDLCAAGGVCSDGRTCVSRSYCVVARTGASIDGPFVEDVATRRCTTDSDCGGSGTCRPADVCVDVEGHRLRGIILFSIGLGMLVTLALVLVMTLRGRRRAVS